MGRKNLVVTKGTMRMVFNRLFWEESIEKEKNQTSYIYGDEDRIILSEMLAEINALRGYRFRYLAELDAYDVPGSGPIIASYLSQFNSHDVKAFLIPQIVSDKVKNSGRLILDAYQSFRQSEQYIPQLDKPFPAHVYVRYDNAFRKLKPKSIKNELIELAYCPIDFYYLPFTMRMLSSWKISEIEQVLFQYADPSRYSPQMFGWDAENEFHKRYLGLIREMLFTAITGLKYYPSSHSKEVLNSFSISPDKDIQLAAKKSLCEMNKTK